MEGLYERQETQHYIQHCYINIEVHTSLNCTIFSHLKYRAADLTIS